MQIKYKASPFIYVLIGMTSFFVIGLFIFFSLDSTKGWNPYGWWFIATFLATVGGGICGFFYYGLIVKSGNIYASSDACESSETKDSV